MGTGLCFELHENVTIYRNNLQRATLNDETFRDTLMKFFFTRGKRNVHLRDLRVWSYRTIGPRYTKFLRRCISFTKLNANRWIIVTGWMKLITGHCCWPTASRPIHLHPFVTCLPQNLLETMIYVCELLTEEPEGGSAMIPVRTFVRLYEYLATLDCSGESPYTIMDDETKEISLPSEPSPLTSTFDSKLYLPSAMEEVKGEFILEASNVVFFFQI